MTSRVVFPAFSQAEYSQYEMRQLVSAIELRFQSLEVDSSSIFGSSSNEFDDLYSPIGHTHSESEITDLQPYLLNISGESIFDLSDVTGTPANGNILTWNAGLGTFQTTSPAGVSISLNNLNNVNVPAPIDGHVLTYDSATMQWVGETPATGGGGSVAFNDLTDVNLAGQAQYDMVFNATGSEWQDTNGLLQWNPDLQQLRLSHDYSINWLADDLATSVELLTFADEIVPAVANWPDLTAFTHDSSGISIGDFVSVVGLRWNNDGTRIYAIYDLVSSCTIRYNTTPASFATPYLVTAVSAVANAYSGGTDRAREFDWSSDGTKIYLANFGTNQIEQFTNNGTPYNFVNGDLASTAVFAVTDPRSLDVHPDGTKIWYVSNATGRDIFEINLASPDDLTTASAGNSFAPAQGDMIAMKFSPLGDKFYALGFDEILYQYDCSVNFDITTATYSGNSIDMSSYGAGPSVPVSFDLDPNGEYLTVVYFDANNATNNDVVLFSSSGGGTPSGTEVRFYVGDPAYATVIDGDGVYINSAVSIVGPVDTDYVTMSHDGTDFNIVGTATTDINITGITAIQAGTVDADFDAITATSFTGIGTGLTALTAANISAGNLVQGVLLHSAAIGSSSAFKVPFLNTTGNVSGNFAMQLENGSTFTYNPSTNTLVAGIYSGVGSGLTGIPAASIVAGSLVTGVNPFSTAVATNSAFQIPTVNTTGVASGNFALQIDTATPMTYNPSTGTFFASAVTGTTIGGITEANLVDKTATEAITGAWTFATAAQTEWLGGTDIWIRDAGFLRIYDSTDTDSATFSHDDINFNTVFVTTTDWDITGLTGEVFIDAALRVSGNFTVSGTLTSINTSDLNIADNIIILNNDAVNPPTENAGVTVYRGGVTNDVTLRWNETADDWEITYDGATYYGLLTDNDVPTGGLIENGTVTDSTLRWTGTSWDENAAFLASATSATITNAQPKFVFNDTDAAADEKNWLFRSQGGLFGLHTATDAAPETIVNPAFTIDRAADVLSTITVYGSSVDFVPDGITTEGLRISANGDVTLLRPRDSAGTAWDSAADLYYDRSQGRWNSDTAFAINSGFFYALSGASLRVFNNASSLFGSFAHDETNLVIDTNAGGGDIWLTPDGGDVVADAMFRLLADINTATPPTTEAVVSRYEIYDADNTDLLFSVGFEGNNTLRMKNFMRGGNFELTHIDAGGTPRFLFTADPDAASELYHIGSRVLSTHPDGISIYDPGNSVFLAMFNAGNRVSYLQQTTTSLRLTSEVHGSTVHLQGEDAGGVLRSIFIGNPDAQSSMYAAGTEVFRATSAGNARVVGDITTATPPVAEAIIARLDFTDADNTDFVGRVGFNGENRLRIQNFMNGGPITMYGDSDGNVERVLFTADPDASAFVYHAGSIKLGTLANGITVRGDITTATPPTTEAITTKIEMYDLDGTDVVGQMGFLATNSMYMYNQMHGGDVRLAGQDAATGAFRLVFAGDPDGAATIYHNGNAKLSTAADGINVTGTMAATTVTGANVTSGADPGHTHTGASISALDAADVTTGIFDEARVAAHTGDVTGLTALTIAVDAVDIPMLSATGTADATTFLRGDNTWSTPSGTGNVSNTGTPLDNQLAVWTSATVIEGTTGLTYNGTTLGVTGDVLATTVGGIANANLVDKAATEAITGAWTFGTAAQTEWLGGTDLWIRDAGFLRIYDSTDTDHVQFSHDGTNFNIAGTTTAKLNITGITSLDVVNYEFDVDQSVGAGQDNYVLTYDNGTGVISLEAATGGTPTVITVANEAADTTSFPLFVTAATGDLGPKTNAGLTFNAATANLNSTLIAGIANANLVDKSATEYVTGAWDFDAGSTEFDLRASIVTATPPTTEAVQAHIRIVDNDATDPLAQVGFLGSNTFVVSSLMHGGDLILRGENAAGTQRNILNADIDGTTAIYYPGSAGDGVRMTTMSAGILVHSEANLDIEDRKVIFARQNGVHRGEVGYSSATGDVLRLRNYIHGGNIELDAEDAGGIARTILTGDPDGITTLRADTNVRIEVAAGAALAFFAEQIGAATIYHNNNAKLSTTATGVSVTGEVTVTTGVNMADSQLDRPRLKDYSIESPTEYAPTGTTQTLSYVDGPAFEIDLESVTGTTTITLSNAPATGNYGQIVVKIIQDSAVARTLVWAGGTFRWAGGTAHVMNPTLNGFSIFTFETWDGGTVWYAGGANYS